MIRGRLARRLAGRGARWLADRIGFAPGESYLRAAGGLAEGAETLFPRELLPLLAENVGRAFLASQVFQLDPEKVWPWWVNRQLDPHDPAYLPRAMSPLWFNLTHRNWTLLAHPDGTFEPIVDPRGMLTPQLRGFSLDVAVRVGGELVAPSRLTEGYEQLSDTELPRVTGAFRAGPLHVETEAWVERVGDADVAMLRVVVDTPEPVDEVVLAVSLRPVNPEGPAPIAHLAFEEGWFLVEERPATLLFPRPDRVALATYREGDALVHPVPARREVRCPIRMPTAAAFYEGALPAGGRRVVHAATFVEAWMGDATRAAAVSQALTTSLSRGPTPELRRAWRDRIAEGARLQLPEPALQRAFEHARLTLLGLDDGGSIKPGPSTYHQHWFRDSAWLIPALGMLGYRDRAREKLLDYPDRQDADGYFRSQEGEWDANGQAIWTLLQHHALFDDPDLLERSYPAIARGADWIARKRRGPRPPGHHGLLPAGISAEHLGAHDHYLWDDFWGVAGLREATEAAALLGQAEDARRFQGQHQAFLADVEAALAYAAARLGREAMPAAPGRRLDAGMVGNLCAVFPLKILAPDDPRVLDTLAVLEERFFVRDTLLLPMVHSGHNVYLTLQAAQIYLAAGRLEDAWRLVDACLALASSTGTFPEAVHPRTGGGCMGDGCHGWAAADLLLFLRNAVLREAGEVLHLAPGCREGWTTLSASGMPTRFGPVSFEVSPARGGARLALQPDWREPPFQVHWTLPRAVRSARLGRRPLEVRDRTVILPSDATEVRVSFA